MQNLTLKLVNQKVHYGKILKTFGDFIQNDRATTLSEEDVADCMCVLLELVENAERHAFKGTTKRRIITINCEIRQPNTVTFTVKDNGIGIDVDIFEAQNGATAGGGFKKLVELSTSYSFISTAKGTVVTFEKKAR
jgi:two-component sensor histidine kinase